MEGGSESEKDYEVSSQLAKIKRKLGKDMRALRNIEEKVKDISKRVSKTSKSSWKKIKPKKSVTELENMKSKVGGICRRFELLISSGETVNVTVDVLRRKVNLINVIKPQITQLVEALNTSVDDDDDDDIGQSSRQFQDLHINHTPKPHRQRYRHRHQHQHQDQDQQHLYRDVYGGEYLNFPSLYPLGQYDDICSNRDAPVLHFADDDDSLRADWHRAFAEMANSHASFPEPKFLDCRELCEKLGLGHLKSHQGVDYDFVGFASILVPVFSSIYGDGLHLNFFARPKGEPSLAPAHLIFLQVANGDPQEVIRCQPLLHIPYSQGDEDQPSSHTIYHPEDEDCPYCEHAKDGSLSRNFCLPPPLM